MAALARAAQAAGLDPRRFQVGNRRNSINPRTGRAEFADDIEDISVTARRLPRMSLDETRLLGRMMFTEGAQHFREPGLLQAIGSVPLNRQGNAALGYPDALGDVLRAPKQFQGVGYISPDPNKPSLWQLSEDPSKLTGPNKAAYDAAMQTAKGLADGTLSDNTGGATRFGSRNAEGHLPNPMQNDIDNGSYNFARPDIGKWSFLRKFGK